MYYVRSFQISFFGISTIKIEETLYYFKKKSKFLIFITLSVFFSIGLLACLFMQQYTHAAVRPNDKTVILPVNMRHHLEFGDHSNNIYLY